MKFTFDPQKEKINLAKHGYDFSFARLLFADPLAVSAYDRFENGEHRYHLIGAVGGGFKVLLAVYTLPDPEDDEWIQVIGLREATAHERRRYEEGDG